MKICFLNQTARNGTGAGNFYRSLEKALMIADPAIAPVVLTRESSNGPREFPILPTRYWKFPIRIAQIRRIFRTCDIIHALDGYPFGVIASQARRGLDTPFIVTAIGTGALEALHWPVTGMLLKNAYYKAARVVAVSTYTKQELLKTLPDLRVDVINHGVDADKFSPDSANKITLVQRSVIAKLKPYILSVGALKPRKGFAYSLRSFALIKKKFPDLRYVIVGNGDKKIVDWEIKALGLENEVDVFQNISQEFLAALYRNAELFILLPLDDRNDVEGFGLVFLEAAASGIPVVGARGSGAQDAVGENGFLVQPRNPEEAAHAVEKILKDLSLRQRLSEASLNFIKGRSWDDIARHYLRLYKEVLSS